MPRVVSSLSYPVAQQLLLLAVERLLGVWRRHDLTVVGRFDTLNEQTVIRLPWQDDGHTALARPNGRIA